MTTINVDESSQSKKKFSWRSLVVEAAKKMTADRLNDGFIAALSPTPQTFIDAVLQDDVLNLRNTDKRVGINEMLLRASNRTDINIVSNISCNNSNYNNSNDGDINDHEDSNFTAQGNKSLKSINPENKSTEITNTVNSVVDFGCGDGRWLIAINKKFDCYCFGIEKDGDRLEVCREKIKTEFQNITENFTENKMKLSNKIELIQCDFSNFCCTGISVVILFLSREGNEMMKEKLEKECFAGTIILVIGVRNTKIFQPQKYFNHKNISTTKIFQSLSYF